jgi:hypothetical protein
MSLLAGSQAFPAHPSSASPILRCPLECSKAATALAAARQSACAQRIRTQSTPAKTNSSRQNKEFGAVSARRQNGFAPRSVFSPCVAAQNFPARFQGLRGSGLSFSRTARI